MTTYEAQFVGVWELLVWTVTKLSKGNVSPYFADRANGFIIYTAEGWILESIVDTGRPINTDDRDARLGSGLIAATR